MLTREEAAKRAARECQPGQRVSLGSGLSALCAPHLAEGVQVVTDGGKADVALVDAAQVSLQGDVAAGEWARDFGGAERVVVVVEHCNEQGAANVVETCSLPVTAPAAAQRIVTTMAVIDVQPEGLILRELADGMSARDVQAKTDAPLLAAPDMCLLKL